MPYMKSFKDNAGVADIYKAHSKITAVPALKNWTSHAESNQCAA